MPNYRQHDSIWAFLSIPFRSAPHARARIRRRGPAIVEGMQRDDDPTRLGRYRDPQTGREFFSGRVGRHDGRPARPFHGELVNIHRNQGGAARGRAGLEYIDRAERYKDRADELEAAGGYYSREDLATALEAVEASSVRKDALIARTAHIELPADSTPEQRRIAAQALADWFEERGHPTRWAIHASPQPHVHLITTARAAWRDEDGAWQAEPQGMKGRPGKRILAGPIETHRWRAAVAATINDICEPAVHFHPGRLADVGIDRPAKVRLPAAEYWRETHGMTSTRRRVNLQIEAEEYDVVQAERRAWTEARRAEQQIREAEDQMRRLDKAKQLIAGDDQRRPLDAHVISDCRLKAMHIPAAPLPPLTEKQVEWLEDAHRELGLKLPDLNTHRGRGEAFGVAKARTVQKAADRLASRPAPPIAPQDRRRERLTDRVTAAQRAAEAAQVTPAPIPPPDPQKPSSEPPALPKGPPRGEGRG